LIRSSAFCARSRTGAGTNLYRILSVETNYTVEAADHMRRRGLVGEHRIRRAVAQVAVLQRLSLDAATSVQMVFLEMEADLQTERHEIDTEWCTRVLKAHEAENRPAA
jgi:hypothetical protein